MVQWLGICLQLQGTWVQSLLWEDPTCYGATTTQPEHPRAHEAQEKPPQREAQAPQLEKAQTQQQRPHAAKNKIQNFFKRSDGDAYTSPSIYMLDSNILTLDIILYHFLEYLYLWK